MLENTYTNIQTGEVLNKKHVESLKDNAMLKHSPHLFKEWDFEKNDKLGLDVYKITKGSKKKSWWICKKERTHQWEASIGSRVNLSSGCPYCSGRKATHEDNLLRDYPDLCEEWDYHQNNLSPEKYKSKSNKLVYWICKVCDEGFNMTISNRTKGSGCPYCAGQKVNMTNCLTVKNSKLASQWHPTKNGGKTPNDVFPNSTQKVWWLGDCGHEWETVVYSRNNGHGCPYCVNKK